MKRPIELVEGILEGPIMPGSDRARGRFGSHEVELRLVDRGGGSTRDPYTEVWILGVAPRPDLQLHVIPQTADDVGEVAVGRGTDQILGDRPFDEAFLVEAAPADVIERLFDASVRARMLALRPLGVHTREQGLLLEKPGWDHEPSLRSMVELGDALATRIPSAFAEADRDAASREGYRGMVSTEARDAARRGEVADVLTRKGAREEHRQFVGCMTIVVILAICVAFAALTAQCEHGRGDTYDMIE